MEKSSGTSQKFGSFLSPGAPNSSIRTPFNSGRTVPSKWEDAERWICSPVSGYANGKSSYAQLQRRPKSKSGPIVPPGTGSYSSYSPTVPLRQGLVVKNLMMGSPFSTGVLAPDALSIHQLYAHDTAFGPRYDIDNDTQSSSPLLNGNSVVLPLVSNVPKWSRQLCDPSSPNSQDDKQDGARNEDRLMSPLSKRDKGTQMSPPETESDAPSSPKSSPTSAMDQQDSLSTSKLEVRDVGVDNQATVIRCSKSNAAKLSLLPDKDLRKSSTESQASGLDIAESMLDTSKFHREEAKIMAWESLQKAKAEAAIRKLEMKLEKKKSSSMDKILNKLRRSQMKAEKMRSIVTVQHQVSKTRKVFSFNKYTQLWSPTTCFGSHAS
ncbi:hypothetical protein RJT34_05757 [Clitoria ternatea]|uniref:Remorin C-terminal domain-containing protein n=1 Tax=Clitoria ternatea TaxID=43366 RepID=A0AAN9PSS2_CLITE